MADRLGSDLTGVYLFGSAALGDFDPRRSDLDLAVVVARAMTEAQKEGLAGRLDHRRLPCPARKLELVVYERDRLSRGEVSFELDLNTGPGLHEWRGDPETAPRHWFVLDVAIGRAHARALAGPPAATVFPEQEERHVLRAMCASLEWYAERAEDAPADTVLNACRAWRYLSERVWSSKTEAGQWAAGGDEGPVVRQALAVRAGQGQGPPAAAARRLAREVSARIGSG